jgi:ketosteroid isomerase-like protein
MRQSFSATLLFCVSALLAPVHAQTPTPSEAPPLQSITLPPEVDRVLRDYERAWRSGDATAVAALFADDGYLLQSGRNPIRGRAAIANAYKGQAGGPLRLRAFAYATSDTTGYILGAYGYGEGSDVPDQGKYTVTLRRNRGGPWQLFSDMDNGNRPPRQGASAPQARPAPQSAPGPQ